MTIYHLRDLASGKRRSIKCEEVKVYQVPYYDNLKIEKMLAFAGNHQGIFDYFPAEEREIKKLPRAYISNVLYTTIGPPFKDWVVG
jgi:hypothetical protein